MKKIFTLALLLIAISIFISSCSQIASTKFSESHHPVTFYTETSTNDTFEPTKGEMNTYPVKGYSTYQNDNETVDETIIDKNQPEPVKHVFIKAIVSSKKNGQNNAIVKNDKSVVKGVDGNTYIAINENRDMSSNAKSETSTNSSVNSSHGLPFWFIVICSFFIPPLGVALKFGITDKFWICLALTFCFWLPGMIYAMIQIFR